MTPHRAPSRSVVALALCLALAGCGGGTSVVAADATPATGSLLQVRDPGDGHVRWELPLPDNIGSYAPDVGSGAVRMAGQDGAVTAYDLADAHIRWRVDGRPRPLDGTDDLVLFTTADAVEARKASTGEVAWTHPTPGTVLASADGVVVIAEGATFVRPRCSGPSGPCEIEAAPPPGPGAPVPPTALTLLDARSGAGAWRVDVPGRANFGIALTGDQIVVGTSRDNSDGDTVVSLSRADGSTRWTRELAGVAELTAFDGIPAVRRHPTTPDSGSYGTAEALDPADGHTLWSVPMSATATVSQAHPFVDSEPPPASGSATSPPAPLGTQHSDAFLRDPRTGERLPGSVPYEYGLGTADGLLVGATGSILTAVRDGRVAWSAPLSQGRLGSTTGLTVAEAAVVCLTAFNRPGDGAHGD